MSHHESYSHCPIIGEQFALLDESLDVVPPASVQPSLSPLLSLVLLAQNGLSRSLLTG